MEGYRLVHHEQRLSALLFMHAQMGQGKQVSQGNEKGTRGYANAIRSGIRGSFSNNGDLRWAALFADSATVTPMAIMVLCRWKSVSAIEKLSSTFVRIATLILQAVPSFGVSTAAISGCRKIQRWARGFGL